MRSTEMKTVCFVIFTAALLAGDQWWPFFVAFLFLVTDILFLVIQYFGNIN